MRELPRVALMIDTTRMFGQELVRGVAQYARYHGPWSFWNEPINDRDRVLSFLQKWQADVIVTQARQAQEIQQVQKLAKHVINVVMDAPIEGYVNVTGDYCRDGILCAEHLLGKGFKNLAFCGMDDLWWSVERERGFQERVYSEGLKSMHYMNPDPEPLTWTEYIEAIARWLDELPKPCGVMACNDIHAARVIEAAKVADIAIPSDIALMGVDNDDMICEFTDPPLTSLSVAVRQAGHDTGEVIDAMIKQRCLPVSDVVINPTRVVTRQSTDIYAIEDGDVSVALDYICNNCKEPIQVADVVQQTATNRRTLERKFKRALHRTINQEIRRVKVDLACKMLLETNYSVLHIARAVGFNGLEHISRYFKKEKGMSLIEYRKQMKRI